jgi:hypothetical protein
MAEFEQLAADALVTLERVLPGQLEDQPPALRGKLRSTGTAPAAEGGPATMDQRPMPAQNRGRLHQEQGFSRQSAAKRSQDHPVSGPPARSWRRSSKDEQLLAEDEELEIAIGSGSAAEDEEFDQQAEESIEEGQQHGRAEQMRPSCQSSGWMSPVRWPAAAPAK